VALQRTQALSEVSDETLAIQASALSDEAAYETLVRRHERRVASMLRRFTRDSAVAEELCQETFLRAWRKLSTFQGQGSFGAWLAAVAYNVFLQHRRRHADRDRVTTSLDDPQTGPGLADGASANGADTGSAELERLLAVVSEDERIVLTLSYAAGLSATDIGAMLGLAPGTVKSQIHRAKDKIRRAFDIEAET
jgi:RNA polymerase sigma-70 factor (ECF subfamily)